MADTAESWASSEAVRRVMRGNRRRDTKPEMALRRALHARGMRYRVDTRVLPELPRRADVVLSRARIAIFVDGCYWHGCPDHATTPKTNTQYWVDKIRANQSRDRDTDERLLAAGWTVLRYWEHQAADDAADEVIALVEARRR